MLQWYNHGSFYDGPTLNFSADLGIFFMKVWITGSGGLVGKEVERLCHFRWIECVGTLKEEVDISSLKQIKSFITTGRGVGITHIVNSAAYTFVDLAEEQPEIAHLANVVGIENLARVAQDNGFKLLHLSSDYVFGGGGGVPFNELDDCFPVGVYATTKREGELRGSNICKEICILRSSWVFGHGGKNFFSSLINRIRTEKKIYIVEDQRSRITFVNDLAEVILLLLDSSGVFHFANEGEVSRFDVAQYLIPLIVKKEGLVSEPELLPVSSSFFQALAKRPLYSVLETSKIASHLGLNRRSWQEAMQSYVRSL